MQHNLYHHPSTLFSSFRTLCLCVQKVYQIIISTFQKKKRYRLIFCTTHTNYDSWIIWIKINFNFRFKGLGKTKNSKCFCVKNGIATFEYDFAFISYFATNLITTTLNLVIRFGSLLVISRDCQAMTNSIEIGLQICFDSVDTEGLRFLDIILSCVNRSCTNKNHWIVKEWSHSLVVEEMALFVTQLYFWQLAEHMLLATNDGTLIPS